MDIKTRDFDISPWSTCSGDCDETVPEDYLDIDLSTDSLRPGGKLAPVATTVNEEGFSQE